MLTCAAKVFFDDFKGIQPRLQKIVEATKKLLKSETVGFIEEWAEENMVETMLARLA